MLKKLNMRCSFPTLHYSSTFLLQQPSPPKSHFFPSIFTRHVCLHPLLRLQVRFSNQCDVFAVRLFPVVQQAAAAHRGEKLPPQPPAGDEPEPPADAGDGPVDWIRVRSDRLDAMVERILELRQEHARLAAALAPATGRVRRHLERSEFRLKELYGSVMELSLLPFDTVAQRLHQARQPTRRRQQPR